MPRNHPFRDRVTNLDNEPDTLKRDAIRAEFLATVLSNPTPQYVEEWNQRFECKCAWGHADSGKQAALRTIAARYGVDPTTL